VSARERAVVVGASLAGVTAVDALRQRGFDGSIVLVGAEPHPPYSRPPLSKGVLKGTDSAGSVMLPATGQDVEVRTGTPAVGLDLDTRRVTLAGGERLPFDHLLIATGCRARTLGDGTGEIVLRTLDDALALRDRLATAASVLVVGGGFLGMEIASAATDLGRDVTVVDVRPPLAAALGPCLAGLLTAAARERGVRIVVSPDGVRRSGGAVELADGTRLGADLIVTAIGDVPNTEWLAGSGLDVRGGVVVDDRCRAAPGVVAAGDVTAFPGPGGAPRRMPHWDNAIAQARVAVEALLRGDQAPAHRPDPYYWTEAFGLAMKIAGPLPVTGKPEVLQGALADRSAVVRWTHAVRPTAVTVNHRLSVARLRRLATPVEGDHR
jgi:3-phenylpropionate/trans-cinnamate dioxygenase ferredoxin reductase subunit